MAFDLMPGTSHSFSVATIVDADQTNTSSEENHLLTGTGENTIDGLKFNIYLISCWLISAPRPPQEITLVSENQSESKMSITIVNPDGGHWVGYSVTVTRHLDGLNEIFKTIDKTESPFVFDTEYGGHVYTVQVHSVSERGITSEQSAEQTFITGK